VDLRVVEHIAQGEGDARALVDHFEQTHARAAEQLEVPALTGGGWTLLGQDAIDHQTAVRERLRLNRMSLASATPRSSRL
jgi:hypothetical protein